MKMVNYRRQSITRLTLSALGALLLIASQLSLGADTLTDKFTPEPAAPVVMLSLDGFRYDYLQRGYSPNLQKLASTGAGSQWADSRVSHQHIPEPLFDRDRFVPRQSRHYRQHLLRPLKGCNLPNDQSEGSRGRSLVFRRTAVDCCRKIRWYRRELLLGRK